LVEYLVSNNLAGKIRVADKVLPDLAGLTEKQMKLFKGAEAVVDFKQANLARESTSFVVSSYSLQLWLTKSSTRLTSRSITLSTWRERQSTAKLRKSCRESWS